ncbi:MAG: precorrin-6A/cobalt-precorrin-6A reductase [Planctomycetota bacterium]
MVTKDGGRAGGVAAKLAAARSEGCRLVVLRRPPIPRGPFRLWLIWPA